MDSYQLPRTLKPGEVQSNESILEDKEIIRETFFENNLDEEIEDVDTPEILNYLATKEKNSRIDEIIAHSLNLADPGKQMEGKYDESVSLERLMSN
jgi:hypothetical protein